MRAILLPRPTLMIALNTAPPTDVLQAIVYANPAPYYAELTAQRPFSFDTALDWWVAASAEAVDAMLGNAVCCVRPADEPVPKAVAAAPAGEFFGRLIHQIDGPDHSARKAKVMTALGRLDVSTLADHTQRHAHTALPEAANPDVTLDTDAHLRVSLTTMAHTLLGSGADAPACQADIAAYLAALSPGASAIAVAQADTTVGRLQQRFADSSPAGTDTDDDGDTGIANLAALFAQTYGACAGLLGDCIVTLPRHAGLTARLRVRPDAIEPFVYGVLRRDAPVRNTRRFVVHDVDLLGHPLRAGDKILVLLADANLDGITNSDPLRFDINRTAPHLWTFGGDAHRCPADALATTIVCEVIQHLLSLREVDRWLAGLGEVAYRSSPNACILRFQA